MIEEDPGTELNPIDLEAVRWVQLLESGPLCLEDQRQLDTWLAQSSRHQGALIRARAASMHLDRLAAFARGGSTIEPSAPNQPQDRGTTRARTQRWMVL